MFCNEHIKPIHGGAKAGALGSRKTCAKILEGKVVRAWGQSESRSARRAISQKNLGVG
jgi:hypothetical protein